MELVGMAMVELAELHGAGRNWRELCAIAGVGFAVTVVTTVFAIILN